ncbi:MAG: transcription elongation factor GreA [Candidatus Lloydbacteria bacterium CG22_combo_CG10-13_8_21_14_all_47_15]|uniref:Transcription elongation factor GreA n=1 Tax=Candidatus Lloydbacteria bacterium CG22_combo_CG10-13_8_21_14_all_47_15 TaxID=1974635 RepID=A0A2H0CTB8_9BACT|nr:MAG: transcription elongation factor GreA [Candidatus Lloydbacteria bacterium CG22_combo_CG10-13_8_21_14_all_47_15]
MTPDAEYLTQEKYNELELELTRLKTEERAKIAEELEFAKSLGDLSENAEYHQAREVQAALEDRIAKLENLLQTAEIISHMKGDGVHIGSTVELRKKGASDTVTYALVGSEEADMSAWKISNHSPLGEAMFGKKKGDVVQFKAPNGNQLTYTIVSIK